MNESLALPPCARTRAVVEAMLDGEAQLIASRHVADCATCRHAAEEISRFDRSLATVAGRLSEGIPDPGSVVGGSRWAGLRFGVRRLPIASMATLAGAVAAGLLLAAIVGTRAEPPTAAEIGAFSRADDAQQALAFLDLICEDSGTEVTCQSTAPDHVHRVVLTQEGDRVVEVEMAIESTDGRRLDLSGVEFLLGRITAAILQAGEADAVTGWLEDAYPTCGARCSTELDRIGVTLARSDEAVTLTLRGP